MSTVHYIVLIDNENETYDTSLIIKTESVEEINKKIVELKQEQNLDKHYVYITRTDDNYDGYVINDMSSVSEIAEDVEPDVSVEPVEPNNFNYLNIIDTSKKENKITNDNVIANKFKNYILIDPAGDAFLNNTTFSGDGLSGAIYKAFKLTGLNHNITLQPTKATLLKSDNIIKQVNEKQAVEARTSIKEQITGIIHAIGPNKGSQVQQQQQQQQQKNINDDTFYSQLERTIDSIINVIKDNKLNEDKSKIFLLPMISAGIYGGNISTNIDKFKAYLVKYIPMIDKLHKDTELQIHLMYYPVNNNEVKVPEFLKEICKMQIPNVDLMNIDAELANLQSHINETNTN